MVPQGLPDPVMLGGSGKISPLVRILVMVVEFFFAVAAQGVAVSPGANRKMRCRVFVADAHEGHWRPFPFFARRILQKGSKGTTFERLVAATLVRMGGKAAKIHQRGIDVDQGDRMITSAAISRRARDMNQRQMAQQLGIDPSTLGRWERGRGIRRKGWGRGC
mgnify:CR=1 FL=1